MRKLTLVLGLLAALTASAQTKIVVLSDIHLMAPTLLQSEGEAWQNVLATDRKLLDFSKPLFDEVVARIKNDLKPQLVLITGDLTKDGELASHEYVVSQLDALRAAGIATLVIPGNHDVDRGSAAVSYDGANTTQVPSPTLDEFAALYANYGYGEGSTIEQLTKSYACEPIDGLVVIGINTGKDATLPSETLSWVCQQAAQATSSGKKTLVMMHHALNEHILDANNFLATSMMNDADNIRQQLMQAGVKVVLSGHFHTSDIAKDYTAALTDSIYDIATGSLVSYPCHYRLLELNAALTQLQITTQSIGQTDYDPLFSADSAKVRLRQAVLRPVKRTAYEMATQKLGEAAVKVLSMTIDALCESVAEAYLIHAEGDEHRANTTQLLERFNDSTVKKVVPGGYESFASMLKDLSPYGIPGRENQTDDLSLTIDLGAPAVTAIHQPETAENGSKTYFDLQGRQLSAPPRKGIFIANGQKRR